MAVLLVGTAAAIGCGEEPAPPPAPPQPVKIFTIPAAGSGETLEYPGEIAATQHAEPGFEVAGKIIEFPVNEGQEIERGGVIARLDPRDFEAAVERAQANLGKAKTDIDRYQILFDKGVSPKSDLDRAQRRHDVTVADFKVAAKALDDATLRAQFSGVVAKKLVADFENVTAKQSIIILQDVSILEITVAIPEQDYAGMETDLTVEERTRLSKPTVFVSSIPDRGFPARLKEFSTTADPVTRTFHATAQFDPPDDVAIRPGMTARVRVTPPANRQAARSVSIPATALVTDPQGAVSVWKVDPSSLVVSRTAVVPGPLAGDRVSIREGLAAGDQIAISGVHKLSDGMRVRRFER